MRAAALAISALAISAAGFVIGEEAATQHRPHTRTVVVPAPAPPERCDPQLGKGTMGVCTPPGQGPKLGLPRLVESRLLPDVSEFQGCALHSAVIFRVYEAGTERQDARARCHAQEAQRQHVWYAVYTFLRPAHGGCVFQALRTIAIVRSLGGVVGPIIADAEVWLPPGFVSCFVHTLQAHGYVAVIYTAPGTWPGGVFVVRVWIAAFPFRPPCFLNACPYLAHQFSEAFNCRGIFGDCSIDEGITSVRQRPACDARCKADHRRDLEARIRTLHRSLAIYGCNRRVREHKPTGRTCKRWKREGDARHRELGR